jgi:transcriptional regulator with GAF, ATPase, and Fis domain
MAAPNKLKEKAESLNKTIQQMLIDAIEEHGNLTRAAIALGFAPATIHEWNKKRGLKIERTITVRLVPVQKNGRRSA